MTETDREDLSPTKGDLRSNRSETQERACQVEETASAKALRQSQTWHVKETGKSRMVQEHRVGVRSRWHETEEADRRGPRHTLNAL